MEDKFTVLQNAEKNVFNRQYRKAIEAYDKLLQSEGEDPSILNTLGDLYLKMGDENRAIHSFDRVVELFSQSGFTNKAIGVCKKIFRMRPRDSEVIERLVDLYKRRGQEVEAAGYLRRMVLNHEDSGDLESALRVQKRIVSESPANPRGYLELGEIYEKQNSTDEAVAQYLLATRMFLGEGYYHEAERTAARILQLSPEHPEALSFREQAEERIEEGTTGTAQFPDEALTDRDSSGEDYSLGSSEEFDLDDGLDLSSGEIDLGEVEPDVGVEGYEEQEDSLEDEVRGELDSTESDEEDLALESGSAEGFLDSLEIESASEWDQLANGVQGDSEAVEVDLETTSLEETREEAEGEHEEETDDFDRDPDSLEATTFSFDDSELKREREGSENLESLLQEADFYLKLDLRDDARRILKRLMESHPGDQRVLQRAREAGIEIPESFSESEPGEDDEEFSVEVESALDGIFAGEEEKSEQEDDSLVYEVASDKEETSDEPHSKYDLGLAYREMGMLEDAVDKFESAFRMAEDKDDTEQAILCCGMLSSTYLQLEDFEKALHWAERGLYFSPDRGFEKNALEYDRSLALESLGRDEEAREGLKQIVEEDPEFRDVQERLSRFDS